MYDQFTPLPYINMEPMYSIGQEASFCCGTGDPLVRGIVRVISDDYGSGPILNTVDLHDSETSYEVEEYHITFDLLLVRASWVSIASIILLQTNYTKLF